MSADDHQKVLNLNSPMNNTAQKSSLGKQTSQTLILGNNTSSSNLGKKQKLIHSSSKGKKPKLKDGESYVSPNHKENNAKSIAQNFIKRKDIMMRRIIQFENSNSNNQMIHSPSTNAATHQIQIKPESSNSAFKGETRLGSNSRT